MPIESPGQEWLAYYKEFPYFSSDLIRDGSHPYVCLHNESITQSIVLVHGLTDSPHYMKAIARFFFEELKYNVYVPLLQCHGLKEPRGMEGVSAKEWKKNVRFAIDCAANATPNVSVGGLSTGGTLSVYMAATNPKVNSKLFLFSAALDLAGGFWGQVKEKVLRSPVADLVDVMDKIKYTDKKDRRRSLIGANPFRYNKMDKGAAKQLSYLMKEVDVLIKKKRVENLLSKPAFAAHSECDTTTSVSGIVNLRSLYEQDRFTFFRIPREKGVSHASLVLKDPVYAGNGSSGELLEKENPCFAEMMDAVRSFVDQHPGG